MSTAIQTNERFWNWRRRVAVLLLLLAVGVLITPVQWYVAYVGLDGEKRRLRKQIQARDRNDARQTVQTFA